MKALTISQPYASLIRSGEKWIENRRWSTNYRGLLAIHAGKGTQYLHRDELKSYPTGCVIAVARLVAVESIERIERFGRDVDCRLSIITGSKKRWLDANLHKHKEGPFCWILEDVEPIEPVAINGAQGLWEWNQ